MSTKHLYYEIERLERELDKLVKVRALHYPVEIEPSDTICHECSHQLPNGDYYLKVVEYPCPTLLTIAPEEAYVCTNHQPTQHRDGKPPWCWVCGRTQAGNEPESIFGKRNS